MTVSNSRTIIRKRQPKICQVIRPKVLVGHTLLNQSRSRVTSFSLFEVAAIFGINRQFVFVKYWDPRLSSLARFQKLKRQQ